MPDRNQLLERYVARGHRRVDGWLAPGAIPLLLCVARSQRSLGIHGHVAEIGIHHGKLFLLLYLLRGDGERALAADLFGDQKKNLDRSGEGDLERFRRNLARHGGGDTDLVIAAGDSMTLDGKTVRDRLGGPARLFSVDGGHTPELTRHDLETASAAIAPGGVIVLDDYFHELWPGVSEGTLRFFQESRPTIVPFAIGANKVLFTTPDHATYYKSALSQASLGTSRLHTTMLGHPVVRVDFAPLPWTERVRQSERWRRQRDLPWGRALRWALRVASRK